MDETTRAEDVRRAHRLAAVGRSGRAIVMACRALGPTPEGDVHVELDLLVSVDALVPYPATVRQVVRPRAGADLVPGAVVHVRIDPVDQQRLAVA